MYLDTDSVCVGEVCTCVCNVFQALFSASLSTHPRESGGEAKLPTMNSDSTTFFSFKVGRKLHVTPEEKHIWDDFRKQSGHTEVMYKPIEEQERRILTHVYFPFDPVVCHLLYFIEGLLEHAPHHRNN